MEIRSAILSEVVFHRGLCFQWLVLFDEGGAGYQYRIGAGEWASDWIESGDYYSTEEMAQFLTILPDVPVASGSDAIETLLQLTSAAELAANPLPQWKKVDWFDPGLPDGVPVSITRQFTEL